MVNRGNTKFYEAKGMYADSTVFDIFSYRMLLGDPETALTKPNSMVVTVSFAEKYFGTENPMGQSLTIDNQEEYVVTGLLEDIPQNSHFTFSFLISMVSDKSGLSDNWARYQFYTYLLIVENATPEVVDTKFPAILAIRIGEENAAAVKPFLQPLTEIHLRSHLFREMETNADIAYIYAYAAIALFIILLACINFMNLATAAATRRTKEVGVRKVAGAGRRALALQYLGEALLMSFMSLGVAIVLIEIFMPAFNGITGKNLSANLTDGSFLLPALLILTVIVGIISGSYPALVLSRLSPIRAIKGESGGAGGSSLRRALVTFQFAVTITLMIATAVVFSQRRYISAKSLGFDKHHLIVVPLRSNLLKSNHEAIKIELLRNPNISKVSASANMPGGSDYGVPIVADGLPPGETFAIRHLIADQNFIDTFGMEIVDGRELSTDYPDDERGSYLINEEAARQLGWDQPVGKSISIPAFKREQGTVVGVVKDFHFRSVHTPISPVIMYVQPSNWLTRISIKVLAGNIPELLASIEKIWTTFDPSQPFTYSFFDEEYDGLYNREKKGQQILGYFTAIAIFIAALGLFGLVTFAAETRTKEIGIRKALGASVSSIVSLLSGEFVKLVLIANLFAWPAAWWAINRWLENFAYRIEPGLGTFVMAGLLALAIAVITVSTQALKAATANPVEALRYE